MIDVLLTILVFFMTITSAQVLKVDKTIALPIAKDAQKKDNSRAETVVNVRGKDKKASFVFDDRVYSQAGPMVERISPAEFDARSDLPDWRVVLGRIETSFRAPTCESPWHRRDSAPRT